ncbi:tetratricopeptide repeat protein [Sphaerospermopsis aphanizomenoides BCCUSP55]|uniref:tetratricopeptide repeat protein n=1 Tax=Sphaerospermopsis aphanizomenoides TaxID=459663 RepID=UPI000AB30683|nr:tetratricopeptide repeat protein [Sphaerospermopsis aphanizomenoides]MBK1988438.1 tetratricopeptide repeat protein [Sphaerospermopsis aphanizomenoides BCCUSP55]
MTTESIEIAQSRYQAGKNAFENGQYRQAVDNLEQASALLAKNTRFAGEVDIWLVNAYEAAGRSEDAIALCQQLSRHPHYETRSQAKRLVYILKAPKLKRPKEWMTEIPDFGTIADNDSKKFVTAKSKKSTSPQKLKEPEYVDLSQVNTKDNRFIWVALIAVGLTIFYLGWLSF